jgi:prepilin signal peptidase PulO-like enzyme (type II secretory pathway)
LVIAALVPISPLPVLTPAGIDSHLHFNSPLALTMWHQGWLGLIVAISIFTIWYLALLPKTINWGLGPSKAIKIMIASIIRPPRKTQTKLALQPRKPMLLTRILTLIWIAGVAAIIVSWQMLPEENKVSLFSSFIGMAVGGGLVWAIRIIGSVSMGQEAMGFGDVTLMFMVGAFLGWQPSLMIIFALAPLSALIIAVVHLVVTGESKLAFGPYLCFGALILILFWSSIWPAVEFGFFGVGGTFLLIIGVVALVLMGPMLFGMQWLKYKLNPEDFEEESNQH